MIKWNASISNIELNITTAIIYMDSFLMSYVVFKVAFAHRIINNTKDCPETVFSV